MQIRLVKIQRAQVVSFKRAPTLYINVNVSLHCPHPLFALAP